VIESNEQIVRVDLPELARRFGGDISIVIGLLEGFVREAPASMAALEEALLSNDCDRARGITHTLKGTLLWVGAEKPASAAAALEARLDARGPRVPTECHGLREQIDALLQGLRVQLRELGDRPTVA
jgi:HPt (histidine-containing phosphotransfer) domain-containing protein